MGSWILDPQTDRKTDRDIPYPVKKNDGIAEILLLEPQGFYNMNVQKADEYINKYEDKSAGAIEFACKTYSAAAGAKMGIKNLIVDLVHHLLPRNLW